eukprot:2048036-Rhodomonas_salina.3
MAVRKLRLHLVGAAIEKEMKSESMFCSPCAAKVPYLVRVSTIEICCEEESTTRAPVGSRPMKISRESVRLPRGVSDLLISYNSLSGIVIRARWVPSLPALPQCTQCSGSSNLNFNLPGRASLPVSALAGPAAGWRAKLACKKGFHAPVGRDHGFWFVISRHRPSSVPPCIVNRVDSPTKPSPRFKTTNRLRTNLSPEFSFAPCVHTPTVTRATRYAQRRLL